MKLKTLILFALATLLVLIGGVFIFSRGGSQNVSELTVEAPTTYEYYWSVTCPHCKVVNEFMEGWDGKEKITMDKYEINESAANRDRFIARGNLCQIPRNQLGVPLLITPDGVCLSGDLPIIEHFENLKFPENEQN